MNQLSGDLIGVNTDIDKILVWDTSQEKHDEWLEAVLKRCEQINLTLNKGKCQFSIPEVTYIIHNQVLNQILRK